MSRPKSNFFDASFIKQTSVTIIDAQIKTIPTTAIVLIAAPGPGKIIVPIAVLLVFDTTAGAYTGVDANASLQLMFGVVEASGAVLTLDGLSGQKVYAFIPSNSATGTGNFAGIQVSSVHSPVPENTALSIKDDWWGNSDYTGGDPANTLKVTVFYSIINA